MKALLNVFINQARRYENAHVLTYSGCDGEKLHSYRIEFWNRENTKRLVLVYDMYNELEEYFFEVNGEELDEDNITDTILQELYNDYTVLVTGEYWDEWGGVAEYEEEFNS